MIHGLDTGFLVAAAVPEHAEHVAACDTLARLVAAGGLIAIAPQVLAEFIHIVRARRFKLSKLEEAFAPSRGVGRNVKETRFRIVLNGATGKYEPILVDQR